MPLSKFIIIVIGLSFLVIPLNVINAQLKIYSSEGIEVIGDPKAFESSKGENWTRVYAPGEQEKEYREALERERQQKVAKEKAASGSTKSGLDQVFENVLKSTKEAVANQDQKYAQPGAIRREIRRSLSAPSPRAMHDEAELEDLGRKLDGQAGALRHRR